MVKLEWFLYKYKFDCQQKNVLVLNEPLEAFALVWCSKSEYKSGVYCWTKLCFPGQSAMNLSKAEVLLLTTTFFWGVTFTIVKQSIESVDVFVFLAQHRFLQRCMRD